MNKKVIAQFIIERSKITLTVNSLSADKNIIFRKSESLFEPFSKNNMNIYAKKISNMMAESNRELKLLITEAIVVYKDLDLKSKPVMVPITSNDSDRKLLVKAATKSLISKNKNTKYGLAQFELFKIKEVSQFEYELSGMAHYDSESILRYMKNVFKNAEIEIIELIPYSILGGSQTKENNFVSIDFDFSGIYINFFAKGMLYKQKVIPNGIYPLIHEITVKYEKSIYTTIESIINYINLDNDFEGEGEIYSSIKDSYGVSKVRALKISELSKEIKKSLKDTVDRVEQLIAIENANEMPKVIDGEVLEINNFATWFNTNTQLVDYNLIDKINDERVEEKYLKAGVNYVVDNELITKTQENIITIIKEKAIARTANHKKVPNVRMLKNVIEKNIFNINKY